MSFATACTEPAPQKQVDNDVGRSRFGQKATNQAGITDRRDPRYQDMELIDRFRPKPVTRACECYRQPVPLVGSYRYQEVGNDVTPKWAIYKFSEFTHLVSQLDHASSRLGLCSPEEFGRPLSIRKIVAVGAPMQTRPWTASLIAYKFGEFQPGVLEVSLTTRGYFPSKVNRVHNILSGCGRTLPVASGYQLAVDSLGSGAPCYVYSREGPLLAETSLSLNGGYQVQAATTAGTCLSPRCVSCP